MTPQLRIAGELERIVSAEARLERARLAAWMRAIAGAAGPDAVALAERALEDRAAWPREPDAVIP